MFFTYHRRSKETGELLAKVLQIPHGFDPVTNSNNPMGSDEVLIRWGNRRNGAGDHYFNRIINPKEAIDLCSHKMYSLELMFGADINVPIWSEDPEDLDYPILGRKFHHARGEDIQLILQKRDLRNCDSDFFTEYIPTNREFRIHVVGDKVIRVQAKYLDNPELKKPWIRNHSTGYRFRRPRLRLKQDRLDMAVRAVKCHGLDFGAVDLLLAEDGLGYVLEVNTAPSCSPLTLGAYAVALHELAELDTEIDLSYLDMLDPELEEMDSDDEGEDE